MTELWLKFTDADGAGKRVAVTGERFAVGRHSANDLAIADGRLSREHLKIERQEDDFFASDLGSSNGTTINDQQLDGPVPLDHGALLSLGGFEISVEITFEGVPVVGSGTDASFEASENEPASAAAAAQPARAASHAPASGRSSWPIFLIAPLLGLVILVFIVGIIFLTSSGKKKEVVSTDDDFIYSDDNKRDGPSGKKDGDPPAGSTTPPPINSGTPGTTGPVNVSGTGGAELPPTTPVVGEAAKIELHGATFLRRIAQNDPKAFLTTDQAQKLNAKIAKLKSSSALADNINSARKNAANIRSLAGSKNLKPQFLAVAAISKLGGSRGDVVQTANSMAEVLDKLGTQIGNELADDTLLMIAAYDQGAAGDTMKMRNMLQDLSNKYPQSSRVIRTIWFLQKEGKITQSEYENALNFLAVGTIAQNPKDFGVNAEALVL